jgi:hypothetical protein
MNLKTLFNHYVRVLNSSTGVLEEPEILIFSAYQTHICNTAEIGHLHVPKCETQGENPL